MVKLKYIGDRPMRVPDGSTQRLLQPGDVFNTRHEHLKKMGYFQEVGKEIPMKKTIPKNAIPQGNKKYRPFVGYTKMDRTSNPKISICIVSKDGDGVIQRCVDAIEEHVNYSDYEVLICDTGTTDKNVLEYYKKVESEKIKIFMGHTYNFSRNNNFLVRESNGEVVLFLNNDVFMTYDAVTTMMKYNNISSIGCVGHRMVFDRDHNMVQHDGQTLYYPNGEWKRLGHYNITQNIANLPTTNMEVEGVTAACLLMDKSIFNEVGGFDEGYIDVLQDVDLNLKVGRLGYKNFCIREKAIIHIDHSSRKTDDTPDSIKDYKKYQLDWIRHGPYPHARTRKDFSIQIVATKKSELEKVEKSIDSTIPYEFNFINNLGNLSYSGQALNMMMETSDSRYQFLTHQDIIFKEAEPFKKLKQIEPSLGKFGVLGIAGVALENGQIRGFNYADNRYPQIAFACETVDEFAMIVDKRNNLRFNEDLVGFHFYGADICLQALDKGLKNYCVDIEIFHNSGGDGNLTYNNNQGWLEFKELGRQLYRIYHEKHPHFATTTTLFNKMNNGASAKINFFIGSVINAIPNNEVVEDIPL